MSGVDNLDRTRVRFSHAMLPIRQRALLIGLLASLGIGLLTAIAILLAAMWFDLTLPLSAGIRRGVLVGTVTVSAIVMIRLFMRSKQLANDRVLALQVDEKSCGDGRVMAGFDLMEQGGSPANELGAQVRSGGLDGASEFDLTSELTSRAAAEAEAVCQTADPVAVLSSDPAKYWWRALLITMSFLAVAAAFVPRLAWTQATRFLIPMESQLPYSATSISVSPGDAQVLFGESLEVIATVEGPIPKDLELVIRQGTGQQEEAVPMLLESERKWRTALMRITAESEYFVRGEGARSVDHHISVQMTPEIEEVRCELIPPPYTNRGTYLGPVPDSGIRGLSGTRVRFSVSSNRPLGRGVLTVSTDGQSDRYDLLTGSAGAEQSKVSVADEKFGRSDQLQNGNAVSGEWEITASGRFSISLIDIDGTPSADKFEGEISLIPDQKPVIRLVQPKQTSIATADVPLPIVVLAEDDFGLSRLTLYRGLNGSPEMGTELNLETGTAKARVETSLPLFDYGLQPGDEITLFARVEDNDPDGMKGAESEVATVRIISSEQLAEIELSRRGIDAILSKQRQAQRRLDKVKQELRQTLGEMDSALAQAQTAKDAEDRDDGATERMQDASKQEREELMKQLSSALNETSKASEAIRRSAQTDLPVDLDPQLNDQLESISDQLSEMADQMEALQKRLESGEELGDGEREMLAKMMEQLGETQQKHEESAVSPTEQMSRVLPLAADQQRYSQLVRRQRGLADRLDALQADSTGDQSAQRRGSELRQEQQQLQVQLSQLLDDIEDHVKQLPADPSLDKLRNTAQEFVDEIRASQADPKMTEAQKELLEKRPEAAAQQSSTAATILESFLSQSDSMGSQACQNCDAGFSPSAGSPNPGNSVEQLLKQMGLGKGQSGMNQGQNPMQGQGNGIGTNGYASRQSSPEEIGIYGGLPIEPQEPKRGNGDKSDGGFATSDQGGSGGPVQGGVTKTDNPSRRGDAGMAVPNVYRKQVADYFRQLAEELGEVQ